MDTLIKMKPLLFFVGMAVFLLLGNVSAYQWKCLTYGQSIPRYTCWHDSCTLCVDDKGYSTDFSRCNDSPLCEEESEVFNDNGISDDNFNDNTQDSGNNQNTGTTNTNTNSGSSSSSSSSSTSSNTNSILVNEPGAINEQNENENSKDNEENNYKNTNTGRVISGISSGEKTEVNLEDIANNVKNNLNILFISAGITALLVIILVILLVINYHRVLHYETTPIKTNQRKMK